MTAIAAPEEAAPAGHLSPAALLRLLWRDKFALASAIFLAIVLLSAILAPFVFSGVFNAMNLRLRNLPPFRFEAGPLYILGGDTLGRPILARIAVAARDTLTVAAGSVALSLIIGTFFGLAAGLSRGWLGNAIMRLADMIMSFPSLLLALVVLYVLGPSVLNVVIVLMLTRLPVYIRTVRAEVLEIRQRMFVLAALVIGEGPVRLTFRHLLPVMRPTLITLATLEFAFIMLTESSLSFLGLGLQPPSVSWGVMVSEGRNYLISAWWIAFWPGLVIMLTTLSLNLVCGWLRVVSDPQQRWRLE